MTQDEIIRMAREAGLHGLIQHRFVVDKHHQQLSPKLERFANLVAEATKAQPQGEWVDLTDDDLRLLPLFDYQAKAIIAKFKEKNTPPVVPQGEPVAWGYFDADGSFMDAVGWQHGAYQTPLYTTPPSVEANDYVLCEVQQEWHVKGWKDAVEKAARLLEAGVLGHGECAAAIRGMK